MRRTPLVKVASLLALEIRSVFAEVPGARLRFLMREWERTLCVSKLSVLYYFGTKASAQKGKLM